MGSIPTWGAVGSGGQVLPRPSVLRYLPGLSVWSLHVHKGFPPLQKKTPTEKTCKRTEHSSSDQDRRFISPGPRGLKKKKLPTAPGVLEEGQSGMGKCRSQIHGDC